VIKNLEETMKQEPTSSVPSRQEEIIQDTY